MWTISNQIRYQIIAQYRRNKLIVNILGKDLHFVRSAQQIFNSPDLLNGFSQEEAALIGYIVGTESELSHCQ
jgi:hypothetical protein